MSMPAKLQGFHHVAYRCKDAKETVEFYQNALGMSFKLAIAEDYVPSTGAYDPYMHVFMDAGHDNVLAFFELPEQKAMDRDHNTPEWVQHIALRLDSLEALAAAKTHLENIGIDVLGPVNHGIFRSIYFFDPNGHRLELAADTATVQELSDLKAVAAPMLEEWSRTKKAPDHARWLHEKASNNTDYNAGDNTGDNAEDEDGL